MRLQFLTEAEAQTRAASIHEWMVQNDPDYAESVKAGETLRWAIPREENGQWFILVKSRCSGALTQAEKTSIQLAGGTP